MGQEIARKGYYSILRWRSDATRDEARNVAVVLVGPRGEFGGIRYGPVSGISPRLREQGLLDALLVGFKEQFESERKPDVENLTEMYRRMTRSLYLTEPKLVSVPDVEVVLNALYRAFVAPKAAPRATTKAVVLDKVVDDLRWRGLEVRRAEYIDDFMFDVVIHPKRGRRAVLEVFSFAAGQKKWEPVEHDAGHFLYALEQVELEGAAVIQPPPSEDSDGATDSFQRVQRWLRKARVPALQPADLRSADLPFREA